MAVDDAHAGNLKLAEAGANGDEIGVHEFDERTAEEEIEADEGQQGGGVVKHASGGFLYSAALFDEIGFEDVAEAAESAERLNHFFERLAPGQGSGVRFAKHGLHHLGDVGGFDLLVVDLGGSAESKVLNEQEVDLVAVDGGFRGFAQVALDEGAQTGLAGVERGHLQQMAQLVNQNALVHGIEPGLHLAEEFEFWLLGKIARFL